MDYVYTLLMVKNVLRVSLNYLCTILISHVDSHQSYVIKYIKVQRLLLLKLMILFIN